jgi:hypothetical protein
VYSNGSTGWATQQSLFDFRKGKDFSVLQNAQPSYGAHSASNSTNTWTVTPGLKQLALEADGSTQSSASTFPYAFMACTRTVLPLLRTWHVVTFLVIRKCKRRNLYCFFRLRYTRLSDTVFILPFVLLGNS